MNPYPLVPCNKVKLDTQRLFALDHVINAYFLYGKPFESMDLVEDPDSGKLVYPSTPNWDIVMEKSRQRNRELSKLFKKFWQGIEQETVDSSFLDHLEQRIAEEDPWVLFQIKENLFWTFDYIEYYMVKVDRIDTLWQKTLLELKKKLQEAGFDVDDMN